MPGSASRVALVRCPKCGHLLPELPPYSVYCCGGCGAFLRAEKGISVDDALSENSGDGSEREANRILGMDRRSADEMPATSARSSKSVRSRHGDAIRKSPMREINSRDSDGLSKSSGRSIDGAVRKPPVMESDLGGFDGHGKSPARSVRRGIGNSPMIGEFEEQRSMGSEFVADYEEIEAREKVGAWFDHVKEETGYSNRLVAQKRNEYPIGVGSIPRADQYVDQIESEYDDSYPMRRVQVPYDDYQRVPRGHRELRVQQRFPVHPNEGPFSYHGYDQQRHYQESSIGYSSHQNTDMNRAELFRLYNDLKEQLSITGDLPENPIRRGHHRISSADHYAGPDDYVHDDPLRLRRPTASVDLDERTRMRPHHVNRTPVSVPHYRTNFHPQRSAHDYVPYNPSGLDPTAFAHRRYPSHQANAASDFSDPQHSSASRLPYSNPGAGVSSHSRSSVGSKSDGVSSQELKRRLVNQTQLVCHPIVGAAPFVICYSCSQLLRLPKKLATLKRTPVTLQCGSCRTTLSFDFSKKSSYASTHLDLEPKLNSTNVYDETSESEIKARHDTPAGNGNRESYDFDANGPNGYTFHSTDSEPSLQLLERRLASSSNASKVDLDLDKAVSKTDASGSFMNNMPLRPPPGSTLQEHLDYSAIFSAKKSDEIETDVPSHDKKITEVDSPSLNYEQNADGSAGLEINSNHVSKLDKKFESSFDSITGRGHKALSPPHDHNALNGKTEVSVNGQPLAHRVVRKAEKMAGPILPGTYWYDSRAGFWGIMGNCCLGIIPPFIEEFGFPMSEDCSGGNTGIYVNGRELHENDLELLASRGFPCTKNKSYVVDISGKVEDEETGAVVANLGKLAPTVERTKRGFGMQPPEM